MGFATLRDAHREHQTLPSPHLANASLPLNRRTKREQNQDSLDYAEQGGRKAYAVGLTANSYEP